MRIIDADALAGELDSFRSVGRLADVELIRREIDEMSTALVTCENCAHCRDDHSGDDIVCHLDHRLHRRGWFCGDAEAKED